jgi:hypothetical protein
MPNNKIREESSIAVTLPDEDEKEESEEEQENRDETAEELYEMYECQQLRKLFVGNLSYNTDSENLKEYFIRYGEIEECNVPVDSRTKLSKGFGFVIYRHSKTLDEVMKLRPHKIDGRILEPRRAIRREEADNPAANASTEKMYVGPIKNSTSESMIREYFAEHGNVTEVEIAKKGDHCFVTFDDFDPVDKCVNMKKHLLNGLIALCKKGLTKTAMIEADQRYHQRKRRRQEREEREKRDFDLVKHGYNPQKDYWRSGHERAPHRKYPTTFGKHSENDNDDKGSETSRSSSARYNNNDRRSYNNRDRSPGNSRQSGKYNNSPYSRNKSPNRDDYRSRSGRSRLTRTPPRYPPPPMHSGYPYPQDPNMHPGAYAYPPPLGAPPPREYLERYYEHYYGQKPPAYVYDQAAAAHAAYGAMHGQGYGAPPPQQGQPGPSGQSYNGNNAMQSGNSDNKDSDKTSGQGNTGGSYATYGY